MGRGRQRLMRYLLPLLMLALTACQPPAEDIAIGKSTPAFELPDLNGKTVRLSDFKGKVVLIDFWATYCVPCLEAVPELRKLSDKYQAQGFEVVGISVDAYTDGVPDFVKELKMTYTVLLDADQDVQAAYGLRSLPETFLLGRDGLLIKHWMGFDDEVSKEIPAAVEAALKE